MTRGCWDRRVVSSVLAAVLLTALTGARGAPSDEAELFWKEGAGLHIEGKYEAAIARYREALRLHPSARTHTYLAWSLSELDRYRDAVRHCRKAIALDPDYPNAYNDLGSYLIELNRPAEAIPWLRQAAAMDDYCCPHYARYQLARAFLMQARVEEAQRALRESLAIRPGYRLALELLRRIRSQGFKGL